MNNVIKYTFFSLVIVCAGFRCSSQDTKQYGSINETNLKVKQNKELGTIEIYRADGKMPIVTANAKKDHRPYIHLSLIHI